MRLTNRRAPIYVAIAIAILTGAVIAAWLVLGPEGDHPPTLAECHAIADEVCPRVEWPHFYTIEKDGKRSWLLGTRHAGVSLARYPQAVADAFGSATVTVFESVDDDGSAAPPAPAPPRDPQPTVDQQLGPDAWAHYVDLVGPDVAARVRTQSVLTATAVLALLYEDTSQTIDVELQRLARDRHLRLVGLEDQSPTGHLAEHYLGIDMLKSSLAQIPRRALLESMTRHELRAYCVAKPGMHDSAADLITNRRTESWVPELVPLLAGGGVFIAVGAEHVDFGSLGLPELLREQGFRVEAVMP